MNSNKSLRIILGAVFLVLVAGVLRWGFFRPDSTASRRHESAGTGAIVEAETPVSVSRPRPGGRLQPLQRPASARTTSQPTPPATQKLYVEWKGTWYAAEILNSSKGSNYIRYSGYGPEWDEWVTPDRMRYSDPLEAPPQNASTPTEASPAPQVRMTPEPGDPVVLYGNRWWRAEVLKTEGDKSLIRYVGYGAEWDEWVGTDRFKVYSAEDARNSAATTSLTTEITAPETVTTSPETAAVPEQPDFAPLVQGRPAAGDLLVEWGKKWWPAEIVKQEGTSYFIHYKNYGTNWDEWVTLERLGIYSGAE